MILLAVETATAACSVALWQEGEYHEHFQLAGNRHSELLLPMVEEVLAAAELSLSRCDAIAYGKGPGSFTGLRIGVGVVQGLAFGAGLPTVGVSSLQAIAQRLRVPRAVAAIDARMGQVYWGAYRRNTASLPEPVTAVEVMDPHEVELPPDTGEWLLAGSGADAYQALFRQRFGPRLRHIADVHPRAGDVAALAAARITVFGVEDPHQAKPDYIRDQVARRPGVSK